LWQLGCGRFRYRLGTTVGAFFGWLLKEEEEEEEEEEGSIGVHGSLICRVNCCCCS